MVAGDDDDDIGIHGSRGSSWFPPVRSILKPCRIILVQRTPAGFEISGETHLDGQAAVKWHVRTLVAGDGLEGEALEASANSAARGFAESTPSDFRGNVYLVDSRAKLQKIRSSTPKPG